MNRDNALQMFECYYIVLEVRVISIQVNCQCVLEVFGAALELVVICETAGNETVGRFTTVP